MNGDSSGNINGNVDGTNPFMPHDDGYKDASVPEEEHYQHHERYIEEEDGDGDDEKEEAKIEEEPSPSEHGVGVVVEPSAEVVVETMDEVMLTEQVEEPKADSAEKVVIAEEDDDGDLDNLIGDTPDIADKVDMADDNVLNAVH